MSCIPVCDETTGYIPPVDPNRICGFTPLRVKKLGKKCPEVCLPIIQGAPGLDGPEGELEVSVNNTSFIDAEYGNDAEAIPERLDLPYQTFQAALTALTSMTPAPESWQFYFWPGTYSIDNAFVPADIDLDVRGSGVNTTILEGAFVNFTSSSLTLANLTLNTPAGFSASLSLGGDGNIHARNLIINRTLASSDFAVTNNIDGSTGEITLIDSLINVTSAVTPRIFSNAGGGLKVSYNEINVTNTGPGGSIIRGEMESFTEISNNTINYSFPNTNFSLYLLSTATDVTTRLVVNDNYHVLSFNDEGQFTSSFTIYFVAGESSEGSISSLLGRNNEYLFEGDFATNSIESINNSSTSTLGKSVDDVFPTLSPIPPPTPSTQVDPDGSIQYQFVSGNTLATNQGIQLATQEIDSDVTPAYLVTDDDFFIRVIGTAAATITLPPPTERIRGKLVVIRNDSSVTVIVAGTIVGATTIAPGEVKQYINNGLGGSWYEVSIS